MKTIPHSVQAHTTGETPLKIPRRIFQTFEVRDVPEGMYQAAQSWISLNPDYEYNFYTDEMRRAFIVECFGSSILRAYDILPSGAFKADIWRYCALYKFGGVYADIDSICKMPLTDLIKPNDEFIIAHGNKAWNLSNGFFCTTPNHVFLQYIIEWAESQLLAPDFRDRLAAQPGIPFEIIGPRGLASIVNRILNKPDMSLFEPGLQEIPGLIFRVLTKHFYNHDAIRNGQKTHIADGSRVVLICEYKDYINDLKSMNITHWTNSSP